MKILIILLFFLLTLDADETLTRLFNQLEIVNKDEKFRVVNEIKQHIIALKQQERVEAIKLLQAKKNVEKKKAEIKNPNSPHSEDSKEIQDCKMDKEMMDKKHEMKQSDMPKMENMPKNMSQMNMNQMNMNQMQNMNAMQNLTTMQNFPVTQGERRDNMENMPESRGRR